MIVFTENILSWVSWSFSTYSWDEHEGYTWNISIRRKGQTVSVLAVWMHDAQLSVKSGCTSVCRLSVSETQRFVEQWQHSSHWAGFRLTAGNLTHISPHIDQIKVPSCCVNTENMSVTHKTCLTSDVRFHREAWLFSNFSSHALN